MLPESLFTDEFVNCTLKRTLFPFARYSPEGEVRGDTDGSAVDDGVAVGETLGDGLLEGFENKVFWPKTTNAEIATAATMINPTAMSIFLFFALVCGLFLPHSGLTWFWLFRNLRERCMPN